MIGGSRLAALRPEPFRGDQVAAGAVVLTVLVALLSERFAGDWPAGVHLAYRGVSLAFVAALAIRSPTEPGSPRLYQTVLHLATFALAVLTLGALAAVLGSDGLASPGTATWTAALLTALAAWLALARGVATGALLGAVTGAIGVLALADWTVGIGERAARWIVLAIVTAYVLASLTQRDRRPAHAVQLVDAAGLGVLAIAASFALERVVRDLTASFPDPGPTPGPAGPGWGWLLVVLAAGLGLVAYASVDHERGPAYLGLANLLAFVLLAGDGDLVGWPVVLAVAAGFMLVVGLRPSTPLPPPPDDGPDEPPEPLLVSVPD